MRSKAALYSRPSVGSRVRSRAGVVTVSKPPLSRLLGLVLALMAPGCAGSEAGETMHHDHHHGPGHDWTHLDDPGRDEWQRPDEVVAAVGLAEGMIVADVGAGTGYFEARLSRAVGAAGKVLALDIDPELVAGMRRRFADAGLANVEARLVQPADPGLAPASVDRVLVVDTWHHLGDRPAYARRLRQALRPGGRLVIVDYPRDAPEGPPPAMRVDASEVVRELTGAGFSARVVAESLPRQYVVVGELGR